MISIVKPKYTVEEVEQLYYGNSDAIKIRFFGLLIFITTLTILLLSWAKVIDQCIEKGIAFECEKAIASLLEKLLTTHSFKVYFLSMAICLIIAILSLCLVVVAYIWICGLITNTPFSSLDFVILRDMLQQTNKVISFVGDRDNIEIIRVNSDHVKIHLKDGVIVEENEFCFPGYIESIFRPDKIDFSVLDTVVEEKCKLSIKGGV